MTYEIAYSSTYEWNLDDIQLSPKLQLEFDKIMQAFRQRGCLVGSEFESHELVLDKYAQREYNANKLYDCHIGDCSIGVIIYDVDVANKKVYLFDIGTISSLSSFFGAMEDLPEACQNYINRFINKAPMPTFAEIFGGYCSDSVVVDMRFTDKTVRYLDLKPFMKKDGKLKILNNSDLFEAARVYVDEGSTALCLGDDCQIKIDSPTLYKLSSTHRPHSSQDSEEDTVESEEIESGCDVEEDVDDASYDVEENVDDIETVEFEGFTNPLEPFSDYTMLMLFQGNEVRRIDFKPLIEKDEAFKPLKDLDLFMNVRQWYVSEESEHIDGAYWGEDDEHHLVEIRCKQLYENSVHCTYLNGSKK